MFAIFITLIFVSLLVAFLIGLLVIMGALLDSYSNERW